MRGILTTHQALVNQARPHYHCSTESNMVNTKAPLITSSPDVLGGTPVFSGTRVPVQTSIEYLEGGETIDDFLEGFPTVTREQAVSYLCS